MNKKVMKLTMALLGAIMVTVLLIGSVQALGSPWKYKEPITLSRTVAPPGYVDFFGDSKNAGSLYLATPLRSTIWTGTLTFDDDSTIEFDSQTDSYIVANLETLEGHTMTKWTLSNNDGGFKGTLLLKTTYFGTGPTGYPVLWPNIATAMSYYSAVLNGYGAYKGQKIVLSGYGPYSGPYEGFLIA